MSQTHPEISKPVRLSPWVTLTTATVFLCTLALSLGGCATIDKAAVAVHTKIAARAAVATPAAVPVAPPTSLTVPVGYDLTLSWAAVTTYTNGAPLTKTPSYKIYNYIPTTGLIGFRGYVGNVLSTKIPEETAGTFCYEVSVQVYDPNPNESVKTGPICVAVTGTAPPPTGPPITPTPVCVK